VSHFDAHLLPVLCHGGSLNFAVMWTVYWCVCGMIQVVAQPALRGSAVSQGALEQALVFDAGSSGTRIHIFNMRMPPGGAHVPRIDLSVRDNQTWKVKPGLSHFAEHDDLRGCRENIERLVGFANNFVEEGRRKDTPVLLKATAGLRAVQQEKAAAVLEEVRSTLRVSGYWFQDDWVDIIKGKEEAGLAWIAANYLHGTFAFDKESLGIIEMGGGSTQVSFELQPGEKDRIPVTDFYQFQTALGKVYDLYAHSYLGFGQDYAQNKLKDLSDAGEDPCYPPGYSRVSRLGSSVQGIGKSDLCESNIHKMLFQEAGAPGHYEHELPVRGSLIATENFFYVREDLKLSHMEGVPPSQAEAAEVCGKDLSFTFEKACFSLSYQLAFLSAVNALNGGNEVQVKRKINGGDIDWALGAALVHLLQTRQSSISWIKSPGLHLQWVLTMLTAVTLAAVALILVRRKAPVVKTSQMNPTLFGAKNGLE